MEASGSKAPNQGRDEDVHFIPHQTAHTGGGYGHTNNNLNNWWNRNMVIGTIFIAADVILEITQWRIPCFVWSQSIRNQTNFCNNSIKASIFLLWYASTDSDDSVFNPHHAANNSWWMLPTAITQAAQIWKVLLSLADIGGFVFYFHLTRPYDSMQRFWRSISCTQMYNHHYSLHKIPTTAMKEIECTAVWADDETSVCIHEIGRKSHITRAQTNLWGE